MAMPEHVHDEQIRIWADELLDAVTIGGTAFEPQDYDRVIEVHAAAERAVRYLVSNLYGSDTREAKSDD